MSEWRIGCLYGVGVGPGDPELLTLKAARVLRRCRVVFAPRARVKSDSLALEIARPHLSEECEVHELLFPMSRNSRILENAWRDAAQKVADVLRRGEDAAFVTLGDCMLYSTFIYLKRRVREILPAARCEAISGIPAFVAAAALGEVPLGEGARPLVVFPAVGDIEELKQALRGGSAVAVMKIGERLGDVRALLRECAPERRAVLVARAGLPGQLICDLNEWENFTSEIAAYLSVIIVEAKDNERDEDSEDI